MEWVPLGPTVSSAGTRPRPVCPQVKKASKPGHLGPQSASHACRHRQGAGSQRQRSAPRGSSSFPIRYLFSLSGGLRPQIRRHQGVQPRSGSGICAEGKDLTSVHTGVRPHLPSESGRPRRRTARRPRRQPVRQSRDTASPRHCLSLCSVMAGQATPQISPPDHGSRTD